jgi:hypothetical protein
VSEQKSALKHLREVWLEWQVHGSGTCSELGEKVEKAMRLAKKKIKMKKIEEKCCTICPKLIFN